MAAVKPGLQRFILFLPFFTVNYFILRLFNHENPEEQTLSLYVLGTYLASGSLKGIAFCFNRGQVTKVLDSGNFAAFVVALLLPVNLAFHEKPVDRSKKNSSSKKTVFEDVEYSLISFKGLALIKEIGLTIGRFCTKAVFCYGFAKIAKQTEDFTFQQSVAHSWFFYFWLTTLEDANEVISLITLNIKLTSNFNAPYLATSVSNFWAKRWNLIVQQLLSNNFYDPVLEGSLVASPKRLKKKTPSFTRRAMGMINVFVASGLIHGYMLMAFLNIATFPVLCAGYFAINGFVVIFEKCLKMYLIRNGFYKEPLSLFQSVFLILYSQTVQLSLAHFFFWPDLVRLNFIQPSVDGILEIGSMFTKMRTI
eukprot:g1658.t1